MKKKMCEINGKRYITPGVFASSCGWSAQKMTSACKDGRVIGAEKDISNNWLIPIDSPRPLEIEQIRQVMVTSLYLKNRPTHILDYNDQTNIVALYTYLFNTGYIEPFDTNSNRIPYDVILTDKGMKLATEGKPLCLNWISIGTTVIQVAASIITIAQSIPM